MPGSRARAEGRLLIDYGFHVNLREASRERIAEIPDLIARGFPRFKFFMFYDGYFLPDEYIFAAMQEVGRGGGLAIVHAENRPVILELARQNAEAGRQGAAANAAARPPVIEGEATHRALAMAAVAGTDVLIFHMTTQDGVRELAGGARPRTDRVRRGVPAVPPAHRRMRGRTRSADRRSTSVRPFAERSTVKRCGVRSATASSTSSRPITARDAG